ncbi:YbaN family protein [Salicibibacter cibarius]|uniref:YbaN family protein n=1 Tax=Salicibibacter cibarius TaxID=2743000 RepID=A0A7T7CAD5_9BACI|nr:YbaN family protein [Salicibibacter cibarius]QQK74750.1 YbaN family protein [Salicibibacter cibarius]
MKRIILNICGSISVALGVLGIVLPLLPTTPFLLLAAACYVRSSDKLYHWLTTNKHFGPYIKNYREGKGIPLKAKVTAVVVLWVSLAFTIFLIIPLISIQWLLFFIGACVTWYILKQKTLYLSEASRNEQQTE